MRFLSSTRTPASMTTSWVEPTTAPNWPSEMEEMDHEKLPFPKTSAASIGLGYWPAGFPAARAGESALCTGPSCLTSRTHSPSAVTVAEITILNGCRISHYVDVTHFVAYVFSTVINIAAVNTHVPGHLSHSFFKITFEMWSCWATLKF